MTLQRKHIQIVNQFISAPNLKHSLLNITTLINMWKEQLMGNSEKWSILHIQLKSWNVAVLGNIRISLVCCWYIDNDQAPLFFSSMIKHQAQLLPPAEVNNCILFKRVLLYLCCGASLLLLLIQSLLHCIVPNLSLPIFVFCKKDKSPILLSN